MSRGFRCLRGHGNAEPNRPRVARVAAVAKVKDLILHEETESADEADSPGPDDAVALPRHDGGRAGVGGSGDAGARGSGDAALGGGAAGGGEAVPAAARGSRDGPELPPVAAVVPLDEGVPDVPFDAMVRAWATGRGGAASSSSDGAIPPPLPPPAVPPPPPDAMPAAGRAKRGRRGEPWGPFMIASVWSQGRQIGWGATCGLHFNPEDAATSPACKKQITYGEQQLADDVCILKLKRWLHLGCHLTVEELGENPRKTHVGRDARTLEEGDAAILDAWVATAPT